MSSCDVLDLLGYFWSLFFSAVWFMTIVSHPDAEITDRQRR